MRDLKVDVEAVHAKGQLNRVPLGGPVGGGKKAGHETAAPSSHGPAMSAGRRGLRRRPADAALSATQTAASTKRRPALYRPGRDTSSRSVQRLAGSSSGGTWSHWTLVELQVQQAVPRP
jgi:hypothetical protein